MTIKKKMILMIITLVVLMLSFGIVENYALQAVSTVWAEYQEQSVKRRLYLFEIESHFGYGGFIHNFKNYVLRGQPKYIERFKKNEEVMFEAIRSLENLNPDEKEQIAINNIKDVASQYVNAIKVAEKMVKEGATSNEIDKIVKIDDSPAFEAFDVIEKNAVTVEESLKESMTQTLKYLVLFIAMASLGIIVFFVVYILMLFRFIKRLETMKQFASEIGSGNLAAQSHITGNDELSKIAADFDNMAANLKEMFTDIMKKAGQLNSSSNKLTDISSQLAASANEVSNHSNTVAAAAEEMSANMNSVAAATEQASTNLNLVATSAGDMSSTIDEIALNSEKGRTITQKAVSQAANASDKVSQLGNAALDIGAVTETINDISEKTDLLALNATIEAARAGDAGKGFAVVASEVKDLARQSTVATGEIKKSITGTQESASFTVKEIEQISTIINQVNEIVVMIATAVEEQSITTKEIAQNVLQASEGTKEINENISTSSTVAREIASDIGKVNTAVGEMADNGDQVKINAEDIANLAQKLNDMIGRFRV
ncbi:MAG: methyl-accepting chemotaxis protein [Proteobacteria bacterium]|nr:methyl-accepting chemotaxis protein [Pseudomonadota bacterium]